jgi:hypothetical protein
LSNAADGPVNVGLSITMGNSIVQGSVTAGRDVAALQYPDRFFLPPDLRTFVDRVLGERAR